MFERFECAWQLARQSNQFLRRNPGLLGYPLLALLSCLGVLSGVVVYSKDIASLITDQATGYAFGFLLLSVIILIWNFWKVALMCAARSWILGGNPNFTTGIACAFRVSGRVFIWSLWSSVVALLARLLREQGRKFKLLSDLTESAWEVVSYFALPVMVFEGASTTVALARSREIASRTWGTALTGTVGLWALSEGLIIPVAILGGAVIHFGGKELATPVVWTFILYFLLVSLYVSALEQIYRVQIYLAGCQPPEPVGESSRPSGVVNPLLSTRPRRMCPACLEPLTARQHAGLCLDVCSNCGGVWLDSGETEQLLAAGPIPDQLACAPVRGKTQYRGSGQRECPVCEVLMAALPVDGITVDHCRQCRGVFFDRGELTQVKH